MRAVLVLVILMSLMLKAAMAVQITYPVSYSNFSHQDIDIYILTNELNIDSVWWSNTSGIINNTITRGGPGGICHQETANVSTACGGLATGSYSGQDNTSWLGCGNNIIDGNISTRCFVPQGGSDASIISNYSIPIGADSISTEWQIVYRNGFPPQTYYYNIGVPQSCFDYDSGWFATRIIGSGSGSTFFECYEGDWLSIFQLDPIETLAIMIYEESIFWNYTDYGLIGNSWPEGNTTLEISLNDSAANINTTSVQFQVDLTAPFTRFLTPLSGANFSQRLVNITFNATDLNLASCWYSNSSGVVNVSVPCTSNISFRSWPEGITALHFWANDSVGNKNTTNVTFRVDLSAPSFTQSLTNQSIPNNNAFYFQANCSDASTITHYSNSSLFTINSTTGIINITPALTDTGNYSVTLNCSDSLGNNASQVFDIYVLNDAPQILSGSFSPLPLSIFNNLTFNFVASDYESNQIYNFTRWFKNGVNDTSLDNQFMILEGNFSISDNMTVELIIGDLVRNASRQNFSVSFLDPIEPIIGEARTDAGAYFQGSIGFNYLECSDDISISSAITTMQYPNGTLQNYSVGSPYNATHYRISVTYHTLGVWNLLNAFCVDTSGNVNSTNETLSVTVQLPGSVITVGGSSGGSPSASKKECAISISPSTILLTSASSVREVTILNKEASSYNPSFAFSGDISQNLRITNSAPALPNSGSDFGVQLSPFAQGSATLILSDSVCKDIRIPIETSSSQSILTLLQGFFEDNSGFWSVLREPVFSEAQPQREKVRLLNVGVVMLCLLLVIGYALSGPILTARSNREYGIVGLYSLIILALSAFLTLIVIAGVRSFA